MSLELLAALVLGSLALLFLWPYVFYGLTIRLFSVRPFAPRAQSDDELPTVTVLIPAHDEAAHLARKLEDTIALDYPVGKLEVIVCSDGSTDGTTRIAHQYAQYGVTILENPQRLGKAATLNRLRDAARGDLILLTDASADLDRSALRKLVAMLADPAVGLACARYAVKTSGGSDGVTESGYWTFEARVRQNEADRDMLLGASGACYLVRRALVPSIPEDTVNDDYVIPLSVSVQGNRIAYVHDAVAKDDPTDTFTALTLRWIRIAYGNYQMLWRLRRLLNPLRPRLFLPLLRKLLRTLGPVFLVLGLGAAWFFSAVAAWIDTLAIAGTALLLVGLLAVPLQNTALGRTRPVRLAIFCTLAQGAYLIGLLRFLSGRRDGLWRRTAELDPLDLSRPAEIPLSVRIAKRTFDLVGAVIGIIVTLPVMVLAAIAVKLDSRGPIFYRQMRLRPGAQGKPVPFHMIKFRSMAASAEAATGPVWAQANDSRVTRVGRFIRRFRIDELPQFFNVLMNDMSIVGPRPERPFFSDQLEERVPGYNDRIASVKPGITGWAQVRCGYDSSIESVKSKVIHDLAYIAHLYHLHTYLKMELKIVVLTVWVMLTGKGSQ